MTPACGGHASPWTDTHARRADSPSFPACLTGVPTPSGQRLQLSNDFRREGAVAEVVPQPANPLVERELLGRRTIKRLSVTGGAVSPAQRVEDDRPPSRRFLLGLALLLPFPSGQLFQQFSGRPGQCPRGLTGFLRGDPLTELHPAPHDDVGRHRGRSVASRIPSEGVEPRPPLPFVGTAPPPSRQCLEQLHTVGLERSCPVAGTKLFHPLAKVEPLDPGACRRRRRASYLDVAVQRRQAVVPGAALGGVDVSHGLGKGRR